MKAGRLTMESQGRVFVPTQNANRKINEWLFEKYVYNNPRMDPKVADAVRVFNDLLEGQPYWPVTPGRSAHVEPAHQRDRQCPVPQAYSATSVGSRHGDCAAGAGQNSQPTSGPQVPWRYFFVFYTRCC